MLFGGVHMEKAGRRKFTDEFKDETVKLVTDQGYVAEFKPSPSQHGSVASRTQAVAARE
jgi:transposase-like protein